MTKPDVASSLYVQYFQDIAIADMDRHVQLALHEIDQMFQDSCRELVCQQLHSNCNAVHRLKEEQSVTLMTSRRTVMMSSVSTAEIVATILSNAVVLAA